MKEGRIEIRHRGLLWEIATDNKALASPASSTSSAF